MVGALERLAGVLQQVDEDAGHLLAIDAEGHAVGHAVVEGDVGVAGEAGVEGGVVDQRPQADRHRLRRRRALAAVVEHRLGKADGAVEGGDEARREALDLGVVETGHLVGEQLRRGQRVAQVVVDLGHRETEVGEVAALAQHREDVGLHRGELVLGDADLVVALARA